MDKFLFGNNLNTLLSTNIDENATVITVSTGAGASFPNPNKENKECFVITLARYDNDDNTEICFVTAKDGDKFTVLRGQEGTIPQKWNQGTKISNRITAEPLNQIKDKANQSDVDEAIGRIDFKPYYKKTGDSLTGAMYTNGNYFWAGGNKTYWIGQDNSWYIKNAQHVTLISFENGGITLNGPYSAFIGNKLQANTITNNGAGKVTFDTEVYFSQPFVAQNSFRLNYNNLQLISNVGRPDTGNYRNTNSIVWQFGEDTSMQGIAYFQEHVGISNNLIFYVSGGSNNYNYVFDNFGKLGCKNLAIEQTIQTNNLVTNNFTIQDNTLTIQTNNITPNGNGFIHGNGIYFNLLKRGVNGSIYLQEHPGIETSLVFQTSGGGVTRSMELNTDGKLIVDRLQTNIITNNNGDKVTFDTSVYFPQSVVTANSVQVKNNDILLSSDSGSVDTGKYRNTSSLKFQFNNGDNMNAALYFQEHAGTSNNLILYVSGGGNYYNYVFDNFGNLYAKNFHGIALQAKYADLAEYYIADQKYDPGTIVKIGGINEITTASKGGFFMGIISTKPGIEINESIKDHPLALPVALAGRVPVKVVGVISKGDPITLSGINGIATKSKNMEDVIGFALESSDDPLIKLVECSVKSIGRC
ncbi:unnamed protein product [Commensalibacter communis]|uniref:Uncharacterized protein n=1 Tax=Commensalibacter communis TaxID=2972786 RepID=A0A9W4TR19_9PROT|nr:hypothetical protein [Commensalibacter communis]CAI3958327.1 unnamed protein product [Commensalibacter communis]CAI3959838.1 unnamed protein product [Commensalibacter communis]